MMCSYFLKVVFAMIVFLLLQAEVSICGEVKCHENEKQSLLKFKQTLQYDSGMLSSWSDDDENRDCCKWKGIECNNQTGLVKILRLPGYYYYGYYYSHRYYLEGTINLTSLVELQNLEHLDLSNNDFYECQIPKEIGSFKNLRYLNLSFSFLGGSIPHELGYLSKLEYLDLSGNDIDGEIPSKLGNLTQLQYLDLQETFLSEAILFQNGNLPTLHTLKLSGNFGVKTIDAQWFSNLHSLRHLVLSSLPNVGSSHHLLQTIGKHIPNLRELRLTYCNLLDNDILSLFHSRSNLSSSLTILDLSHNMLTSSTFQLLFNFSHNLQELYLSYNNIVLNLSLAHYPHFPSLVILDLSYNNLTSSMFLGNFNFSSKLLELHLQYCNLTDKSFLIPSASIVSSSSSLIFLDLSSNLLTSSVIFHWIFNFTTNLHSLSLHHNLLECPIPNEFGKLMNTLEVLDLSFNKLQGEVPASIGKICTLQELYLGNNNLSGQFSNFIQNSSECNSYMFQTLDLSHNWITGTLPDFSILTSLRRLDLSNNQLNGEIPKSIGSLDKLEYLHLEQNHFEDEINELHFTNLFELKYLDLTDNSLSLKLGMSWVSPFQIFNLGLASCKLGPSFPNWLHTQNYLSFLDISNAGIDDYVPDWFWPKLQSIRGMNMSYNNLKSTIPNLPLKLYATYTMFATYTTYAFLNSNQFEGGIPPFLLQAYALDLSDNKVLDLNAFLCNKSTTTNVRILDLSNNQIVGQLPDCWDHLHSLQILDISNNNLTGKVSQSMKALVNLNALVLQNNSLTGELPSTLKNLSQLVILDASENFLSGPIPLWIGESLPELKILSL